MPSQEPMAGETEVAYAAYLRYRDGSPAGERSVRAAMNYEMGSAVPGQAKKWYKDFKWRDRALEWDAELARSRTRGAMQAARHDGADWERRRTEMIEKAYTLGMKLMGHADTLARMPVARTTSPDGLTVIEPVSVRELKDAADVAMKGYHLAFDATESARDAAANQFDPEACEDIEELKRQILSLPGRAVS